MQTALKLSWHNLDASEALDARVREEVARLERFSHRITGCAVTLEAPSHHHRHSGAQYRVRIELTVPRGKLVVGQNTSRSRAYSSLHTAIKAAFRAAQRQLEDHAARVDARVKEHAPPATATVARILKDDGYGFLATPDGREIYFHAHSVVGGAFAALEPGAEVRFVEEAGDDGPQASTVTPLRAGRRSGAPASRREVLPQVDPRSTALVGIIGSRRSRREFGPRALQAEEAAALLWAAQGITSPGGGRAAPSAGGLHPLALRLVDARGVWRYVPAERALVLADAGDHRARLAAAALAQECVATAPVTIAIAARPALLSERYGPRRERYCTLEAGHVAQNVLLMAAALGLAAVPVAAFDDGAVRDVLGMDAGEEPLYLVPVGAPASSG